MSKYSIAIVGGGVSGLATANALAARGIESVVLERRRSPGDIDRGDIIHSSAFRLLRRWGLQPQIEAAKPLQFNLFRIYDNDGQIIFELDLHRVFEEKRWFSSIRHPTVETLLEEGAKKSGLVEVIRDCSVQEAIVENGRVVGIVTDHGTIRAQLTVLATGSGNRLVDNLFTEKVVYDYQTAFYNIRYQKTSIDQPVGFYVIGRRGILVGVPLPDNQVRIGIQYSRCKQSRKVTKDNAASIIRERMSTFSLSELQFLDMQVYKLTHLIRRRLWRPGIVVIGDAAHTVHPVGGQGMNLAMQDAERLAMMLGDVGFSSSFFDRACSNFHSIRSRELRPIVTRTHLMGRIASWEHPGLVHLRQMLIKAMNKTDFLKRIISNRITEVK